MRNDKLVEYLADYIIHEIENIENDTKTYNKEEGWEAFRKFLQRVLQDGLESFISVHNMVRIIAIGGECPKCAEYMEDKSYDMIAMEEDVPVTVRVMKFECSVCGYIERI